jgi:hypothetical protein
MREFFELYFSVMQEHGFSCANYALFADILENIGISA